MGINFLQINVVMKLESKGESFSKILSNHAEYIRLSKIYLFKFKMFFFASSQWANWAIKSSLARVSFTYIYSLFDSWIPCFKKYQENMEEKGLGERDLAVSVMFYFLKKEI